MTSTQPGMMDALDRAVAALRQVEPRPLAIALALVVLLGLSVSILWPASTAAHRPPMLRDPIPYVTNTYQYMANMNKFLSRAT